MLEALFPLAVRSPSTVPVFTFDAEDASIRQSRELSCCPSKFEAPLAFDVGDPGVAGHADARGPGDIAEQVAAELPDIGFRGPVQDAVQFRQLIAASVIRLAPLHCRFTSPVTAISGPLSLAAPFSSICRGVAFETAAASDAGRSRPVNEFGVRQIDSGAANQVVFRNGRSVRPESDRDYPDRPTRNSKDILVFGVDLYDGIRPVGADQLHVERAGGRYADDRFPFERVSRTIWVWAARAIPGTSNSEQKVFFLITGRIIRNGIL